MGRYRKRKEKDKTPEIIMAIIAMAGLFIFIECDGARKLIIDTINPFNKKENIR
jgi:hypothetical protein